MENFMENISKINISDFESLPFVVSLHEHTSQGTGLNVVHSRILIP